MMKLIFGCCKFVLKYKSNTESNLKISQTAIYGPQNIIYIIEPVK